MLRDLKFMMMSYTSTHPCGRSDNLSDPESVNVDCLDNVLAFHDRT